MSRKRWLALGLSAIFVMGLASPAIAQTPWAPVWSDEFDGTGLPDPSRWTYDVGGSGWGNNELQFHTEARTENVRQEGGVLVIEARKEPFGGRDYTSGRIITRGLAEWQYGRFEVSARLPSGVGTWPAIWLLYADGFYGNASWPDNGEIDMMEHVGFDPGRVHATLHTDLRFGDNGHSASTPVPTAETEFHVYSMEWSPELIQFFVDGERFHAYENDGTTWSTWPFDRRFFMVLNVAIGGDWGGQQGVDDSIFPQRLEVDYVRVYEYAGRPDVTLENPAPGPVAVGTTIESFATASDPDGSVDRVEFLQGDGLLFSDDTSPYEVSVVASVDGCFDIRAVAYDDLGWSQASDTAHVEVGTGCPQAPYLIAPAQIPGTIEAEYFDLGGPGEAYSELGADNTGGAIRLDDQVDIERTGDSELRCSLTGTCGGYNVTAIASREWLEYTVEVAETGLYEVSARVASEATTGSFQLEVGGTLVAGPIDVTPTGGNQSWITVKADSVHLDAGVQVLTLRFPKGGFNINRLVFEPMVSTSVDETSRPRATLHAYPTPSAGTGPVVFEHMADRPGRWDVALYDLLGRRVITVFAGDLPAGLSRWPVDVTALPAGVYIARADGPGAVIQAKLIKQ